MSRSSDLFGDLERTLGDAETFPEAISVIVAPWRRLLVDHDFALGCPLAATICDAADNDSLRAHVSDVVHTVGERQVADAYTRFGAPPAEAEAHATVLMAALEGALILARAQRSSSRSTQPSASSRHALQTHAEHRRRKSGERSGSRGEACLVTDPSLGPVFGSVP